MDRPRSAPWQKHPHPISYDKENFKHLPIKNAVQERAEAIILKEIQIVDNKDGKVRVARNIQHKGRENLPSANARPPGPRDTAPSPPAFPFQAVPSKIEYEFKPPAAARFFLWDNTRIGSTYALQPEDLLHHSVTIASSAMKALRIELLKRNLLIASHSTIALNSVTGYLLGRENGKEMLLDRFDSGSKGKLDGDVSLQILSGLDTVNHGFNYISLLERLKNCLDENPLQDLGTAFPIFAYFQYDGKQLGSPFFRTVLPSISLELYPIHPLRLVNTTLSHNLLTGLARIDSCGLLSIDQARQLFLLTKNDPTALSIPLIGMWFSGLDNIDCHLVHSACLAFIANRMIKKLDTGKHHLLIYHFPTANPSRPECYECIYTENQSNPWLLFGTGSDKPFENKIGGEDFAFALNQIFEIPLPMKDPVLIDDSILESESEEENICVPAIKMKVPDINVVEDPEAILAPIDLIQESLEEKSPCAVESMEPVDHSVSVLQQQIEALKSQISSMSSPPYMHQSQMMPPYFPYGFHSMMQQQLQVPIQHTKPVTRDASTSPIPWLNSCDQGNQTSTVRSESIATNTEVEESRNVLNPACKVTEVAVETEEKKENLDDHILKGHEIIVSLVNDAEQSFLYTDTEGESLSMPCTAIFSHPKPPLQNRLPLKSRSGLAKETITEEAYSRMTFDDASLSFATTKYLEKYGLSP